MEKKFPSLHAQNIPVLKDTERDALPKLLRNEKDKQEFANRLTTDTAAFMKTTVGSKVVSPENKLIQSQQLTNTMKSTDFRRVQDGDDESNEIPNIKQGMTFDKQSVQRAIHNRTRSMTKGKIGKGGLGNRRDLNPNNLFLRQQPNATTYTKDPINQFMKKPFLDNLPTQQKNFYANKKGFISFFEDVTKINHR